MPESQPPESPPTPAQPEPMPQETPPATTPSASGEMDDEQIGQTLEMAHQSLQEQNMQQAALHIREASEAMKAETVGAPMSARMKMEDSAKQLDKVADKLDAGQKIEPQKADLALAQAANAMASYHQAEAKDAMKEKNHEDLGEHIKAAADDLGRAAKWTGAKTETGVRDVVGGAVELSGKVTEGVGEIPKETGKVIQDLGKGIDKVGKDITGKKGAKSKKG
jgi:hypothetical protein